MSSCFRSGWEGDHTTWKHTFSVSGDSVLHLGIWERCHASQQIKATKWLHDDKNSIDTKIYTGLFLLYFSQTKVNRDEKISEAVGHRTEGNGLRAGVLRPALSLYFFFVCVCVQLFSPLSSV